MNKLELKRNIIAECLKLRVVSADQAKSEMDEIQRAANEYGSPKDRYDSFRTQLLRKRDLFAEQYQKALDEIKILEKIQFTEEYKTVCFGSVVITDQQKLLVAISIGKIIFNGDSYFAISPQVPFFKIMEGLKIGDTCSFNGKVFKIIDIF